MPATGSSQFKITRRQSLIVFGLAVLVVIGLGVWTYFHPPSPEEMKAIQASSIAMKQDQDARAAAVQAASERISELCHLRAVCAKYGSARQECATAGNYKLCIEIKLGQADAYLVDECSDDGGLQAVPDKMPGAVECWIRNYSR